MSASRLSLALRPDSEASAIWEEEQRLAEELQVTLVSAHKTRIPVDIVERAISFRHWVLDGREPYVERDIEDKFGELIDVARRYAALEEYFSDKLRISATTLWRWAKKRTRPSVFIGHTISTEVRIRLLSCVADDLDFINHLSTGGPGKMQG